MNQENYSFYLDQALELLNSTSDNCLNLDERAKKSIELAELLILDFKENISVLEKQKSENFSIFYSLLKEGKVFFSHLIDQSFRSSSSYRIIDQVFDLLVQYGIPPDAPFTIKFKIFFFKIFGSRFPKIFNSLIQKEITKECQTLLCFTEKPYLQKYLQNNKKNETIFWLIQKPSFGSKTVKKNLKNILNLIENPKISSFCINLSNLFSNISSNLNILAKDEIEKKIDIILQAVLDNPFKSDKEIRQKLLFLNFDTHKNLNLLIELFEKILFIEKFLKLKIGITLKAYFPESFEIQKKLIELAKKRKEKNGCEIVIRITKGSNLNLEQIEASKNNWPSPTFIMKIETDANFKKMIEYGCKIENIKAANLVISSCNIFDVAYSLILIKENKIEPYVFFELSEERLTRSIGTSLEKILGNKLKIFCPIVNKKDFHLASFFVLRKINDFTNPENFIFHLNTLFPGTKNWEEQLEIFKQSLAQMKHLTNTPKQIQNRNIIKNESFLTFENESITDFNIPANVKWAKEIVEKAKNYIPDDIPIVINGEYIYDNLEGIGIIPSTINQTYKFSLANESQIETAIITAKQNEKSWAETPIEKRYKILIKVAQKLREKRAFFIQSLIVDISKSFEQADLEISDAIDAIEYQCRQMLNILSNKDLELSARGTFLIIPPWGFALSAGVEALTCALISGNVVIYKPLEESVLISYHIANLFWEATVPKECLQFLNCTNEFFKKIVSDQRVNSVVTSTSSENVKKLLKLRNGSQLTALAGGINTIIATDMSDKEQAIKDIINSAFKFSGQKFSSASILILEKNLYDDLEFRENLKDAASYLITGDAFDLNSVITPLIKVPDEKLKRALTTLDKDEWWLVKPKQDPNNPRLFSLGIKYGVKENSFTKKHQLHGPILSVMKANNLSEAIKLANDSNYALSSGLQSLDIREHYKWLKEIKAGNYYINTKITDAKIKRQPFGGYKESSFGSGFKSGGPNYILDFLKAKQTFLPKEKQIVNDWVKRLTSFLEKTNLSNEQLAIWHASIANYAHFWKRLKQNHDYCKILGQDNFVRYVPRKNITLRITEKSFALDALRVCAAALTCSTPLEISWTNTNQLLEKYNWIDLLPMLVTVEESKEEFYKRIEEGKIKRIRLTTPASEELKKIAAQSACYIIDSPVLANGRFELLHYIKEISVTYDYHRYGNLGSRESEMRKPVL